VSLLLLDTQFAKQTSIIIILVAFTIVVYFCRYSMVHQDFQLRSSWGSITMIIMSTMVAVVVIFVHSL